MRLDTYEIVPPHRPGAAPPWRTVRLRGLGRADAPVVDVGLTVGLAALELPELLLPAGPAQGAPEPSWRLADDRLAAVLDTLAERLAGGRLWAAGPATALPGLIVEAGTVVPVPLEALDEALPAVVPGLAGLRRDAADAVLRRLRRLLAPDGRPGRVCVAPLPWALTTVPASAGAAPPGPATQEAAAVRARTALLRGEILERGGRPGHVPARWRPAPPGAPPGGPGGERFGPRAAVVVARAEQVLVSDARLLAAFARLSLDLADGAVDAARDVLDATPGAAGREGVPAELRLATDDLMTLLTGQGGHTARWREAWQPLRHRTCPRHRPDAEAAVHHHVRRQILGLLAAEAFADVLPDDLALRARLAWLGALDGATP